MATEIIATSRLSLRASVPSDLALLHMHVFSDAEVMRYVLTGVPLTLNQAEDFFDSSFDHHGTGRRLGVLVERSTQAVIGFSGLMPCQALGAEDYELGFVLSRQAWAKGYATEIGFGRLAIQ